MDDLLFLRLLQLFDSQCPVGAFAHSGGLETYAQAGIGPTELGELLAHQLEVGWGRADLAAAALAWRAAQGADARQHLERLALQVEAFRFVPGLREMSLGLGRRTLSLLRRLHPDTAAALDLSRPHHAVVIGAAGWRLGFPVRELLLAFGHAGLAASLAAATRCMPLSPVQAQSILLELQPLVARVAQAALADPEGCFFACTPAFDIRSHEQAFLYTRLFQS